MSKVNVPTTFRTEDFESEQRKWLPRLFNPLNLFLTAVVGTINGRIEFGSNIPSQDKLLSFTYDGTPQRFTWNVPGLSPKIAILGEAYEGNDAIALVPVFSYNASTATISLEFKKLNGNDLTTGTLYEIFVRIIS